MKPIEFAEKQLKNETKRLHHLMHLYEMTADENDFERLKQQAQKVKEKKEQLERVKNEFVPKFFVKLILNEIERAKQSE